MYVLITQHRGSSRGGWLKAVADGQDVRLKAVEGYGVKTQKNHQTLLVIF